jgi:hypothetical protein
MEEVDVVHQVMGILGTSEHQVLAALAMVMARGQVLADGSPSVDAIVDAILSGDHDTGQHQWVRRSSRAQLRTTEEFDLFLGTRVYADFKGRQNWHPGAVACCHSDGSYDVKYDDGQIERCNRDAIKLATDNPLALIDFQIKQQQRHDPQGIDLCRQEDGADGAEAKTPSTKQVKALGHWCTERKEEEEREDAPEAIRTFDTGGGGGGGGDREGGSSPLTDDGDAEEQHQHGVHHPGQLMLQRQTPLGVVKVEPQAAWVECESCGQWRKLPHASAKWAGDFTCAMATWPGARNDCSRSEEEHSSEEEVEYSSSDTQLDVLPPPKRQKGLATTPQWAEVHAQRAEAVRATHSSHSAETNDMPGP